MDGFVHLAPELNLTVSWGKPFYFISIVGVTSRNGCIQVVAQAVRGESIKNRPNIDHSHY